MAKRDGGQAFPSFERERVYLNDADRVGTDAYVPVGGMTLRQYYKGQALAGMQVEDIAPRTIARMAAATADAMLDEDEEHEREVEP